MVAPKNLLRADETVQKMLISTPSWLVGQYDSRNMAITHAWPNMYDQTANVGSIESPISRCGFVLAFRTPSLEKKAGVVIPDYSPTGERMCAYMSMLFGKKFDCHGMLEGSGFYQIPNFSQLGSIHHPGLPFNSHSERKCFPIPLELNSLSRIQKAIDAESDEPPITKKLDAVCRHYMQSLQNAEGNIEVAYLNLITAGEILSSCFKYSRREILDEQTLDDLQVIADTAKDGAKIEKRLSGQLIRVKRKFVMTLCRLVDEEFFSSSECDTAAGRFSPQDVRECVGAAYDLRSTYVHTGVRFGGWVGTSARNEDVQIGRPVEDNKKLGRILARAPRFAGLERLIRYCCLRYMEASGLLVESHT